ncbi:sensor histidine kinase [Candidatus Enterococcus ferrettii]|uniref:histidine kinase n=1 Tax=Candidatus Enterococcus ferrettii TaxID=2815324 RepID=A0ABV0EP35_9ENTE|nr:histidine kinase [Enterococcus sp. 665A]MBO1342898.1 sensor histidine kinase [Enterococcus sp. 665A]
MRWNSKNLSLTIRFMLLIILFFEVSNLSYTLSGLLGLFFIICLVAANDFYRTIVFDRNSKEVWINLSILLSISLIGFIGQMVDTDFIKLFVYLTIPEIVQIQLKKKNKWLSLVVFFLFCFLYIKTILFDSDSLGGVLKSLMYTNFIPFWSVFLITYLYLNLLYNKQKIEDLNSELVEKVDRLEKYSEEIKEVSILQERQRISQQLHDMLGHSLIALKLHLEAVSDIIDEDVVRAKDVLEKSEGIIDQSFLELKATVNELNQTFDTEYLSENLENMALRFSLIDNLEVNYSIETDIDDLTRPCKEMLLNISREAITNSIKHGQSTIVTLRIFEEKNVLTFIIVNNGCLPKDLVASNGMKGMKKRVTDLDGKIQFIPGNTKGLTIKIEVPLKEN